MAEEQNGSNERHDSDRGFAGMDEARQREIASKGGKASDENRSGGSNQRGGQDGGENADQNSQGGDQGNPGQGGRS